MGAQSQVRQVQDYLHILRLQGLQLRHRPGEDDLHRLGRDGCLQLRLQAAQDGLPFYRLAAQDGAHLNPHQDALILAEEGDALRHHQAHPFDERLLSFSHVNGFRLQEAGHLLDTGGAAPEGHRGGLHYDVAQPVARGHHPLRDWPDRHLLVAQPLDHGDLHCDHRRRGGHPGHQPPLIIPGEDPYLLLDRALGLLEEDIGGHLGHQINLGLGATDRHLSRDDQGQANGVARGRAVQHVDLNPDLLLLELLQANGDLSRLHLHDVDPLLGALGALDLNLHVVQPRLQTGQIHVHAEMAGPQVVPTGLRASKVNRHTLADLIEEDQALGQTHHLDGEPPAGESPFARGIALVDSHHPDHDGQCQSQDR